MPSPKPSKSKPQLPPEVWALILPLLAKPIPKPLSTSDRYELRQGSLCVASRVCKLFSDIIQPLLYTTIVSDELILLFYNVDKPHSALRRFRYTKTLLIEYRFKGPRVTYKSLLSSPFPNWMFVGQTMQEAEMVTNVQCGVEVRNLTEALDRVVEAGGLKRILPNLEKVAIASICGADTEVWNRYHDHIRDEGISPPPTALCTLAFLRFLCSGDLHHACIREGPLTLPTASDHNFPDSMRVKFPFTQHFGPEPQFLALPLGKPNIRWVSDIPSSECWSEALENLGLAVGRLAISRKADAGQPQSTHGANLDIYFSTSRYPSDTVPLSKQRIANRMSGGGTLKPHLSVAEQRQITDRVGPALEALVLEQAGVKDSIRCHPSADSPSCPSCGTEAPA